MIEKTNDYDEFICVGENRPIRPKKVRSLMASIKEKNFLKEHPIIVRRHDLCADKYIVLDGQHRLEAARNLRLDVYFIISETMDMLDVPEINSARASWTANDYLNYYVKMGNKEYEMFQYFADKYKYSIYATLEIILDSSCSGLQYENFKHGRFVLGDVSKIKERFECLLDYKEFFSSYKNKYFARAVLIAKRSGNYDRKRMRKKLEYLSRKLVKCPDTLTYIGLLEEIYNYNQSNQECVSFTGGYRSQ